MIVPENCHFGLRPEIQKSIVYINKKVILKLKKLQFYSLKFRIESQYRVYGRDKFGRAQFQEKNLSQ